MTKKYNKLEVAADYDHEKVEQLAEAMTELLALQSRQRYLQELIDDNKDLHQFIWGTSGGTLIAYHKIEGTHLQNIMAHCVRSIRQIPKNIKAEARKRGFDVPDELSVGHLSEFGYLLDEGDDND